MYAVNDTEMKWDFNNVYGTGQSILDGILPELHSTLVSTFGIIARTRHSMSPF